MLTDIVRLCLNNFPKEELKSVQHTKGAVQGGGVMFGYSTPKIVWYFE